jgi:EmrB/QacA subfamily drug resistance transporter
MSGVVAAMLLAALDATIVGTAMPRIIAELHGFEHYAAVTTIYMLTATVTVPIVGKLSDLYGRKPFLLAGVALFVAASALCGMAASMTQLVIFRGIQGIGAGFSQAMAFTTIADLFPPARRGRASGVLGAVFGFASVIGPAVGGFLTDGPGWRWCFYVNIPIGIAALAILFFAFPHIVRHRTPHPIDWPGADTLVLAVLPLLLALSWGGRDYPSASTEIITLASVGIVMTAVFLFIETRMPEAILPPTFFKNRVVWTSSAAATFVAVGMFGSTLFIPLFLQGVIGESATRSGAVVTPMMFSLIAASMTSGQIIMRRGRYKAVAVVGVSLAAAGMFLLARMDASTAYGTVMRNMMVMGVGLGLTMPVFPIAVQNAVDVRHLGVATSSIQFLRSMGGALGAAAFGAVLTNRFSAAIGRALGPDISAAIPPDLRAAFENPQALMNPEVAARIQAAGPEAVARMAPAFAAVRGALTISLQDVFFCGAVIVLLGVVFASLLVDLPLRQTNRSLAADTDPGMGEVRQAEM